MKILLQLDELIEKRRKQLSELRREKGYKVMGYICCKVPVEIPHALGMITVRLGIGDQQLMTSGKTYIHQYACPYVKSIVGQMQEKGGYFRENVDVLSGYVTCASVHRCIEVLKQYTGKPTYYITHPLTPPGDNQISFYLNEIHHFIAKLEDVCNVKLDKDRLADSVSLYNGIRKLLLYLYRLNSRGEHTIKWSDIQRIVHAGFIMDPGQYHDLIHSIIQEVEAGQNGINDTADSGPRLMVLGSPMLPGDQLLIKVIEDCNTVVVTDNLCTGLRSFETLTINEPTVEGIAKAYLFSNPCASVQYLDTDEDDRLAHILRLIKEYDVQGVVYYALRFCDPYAFKDNDLKTFLAKRANVPMISIHAEYGEAEEGRLRTRIQGLLETISLWRSKIQ
jgi:benzoyl-CoA reductase/2-hydroxyglutaryl-CoA dehydratase subunit BcrC/BadD/HgdB